MNIFCRFSQSKMYKFERLKTYLYLYLEISGSRKSKLLFCTLVFSGLSGVFQTIFVILSLLFWLRHYNSSTPITTSNHFNLSLSSKRLWQADFFQWISRRCVSNSKLQFFFKYTFIKILFKLWPLGASINYVGKIFPIFDPPPPP